MLHQDEQQLRHQIRSLLETTPAPAMPEDVSEAILRTIISSDAKREVAIVHRVHFLRTAWFRVAVAVLVVMSGVLAYYRFADDSKNGKGMAVAPVLQPEIMPGSNKAVLVLSDGRKVELNDAASQTINDGDLVVKNNNGLVSYEQVEGATHPAAGAGSDYAQDTRSRRHPSGGGDWRASYNTMSTPRGGQYKLVLPDGSKVWLNAESSITFPTVFAGKTREIKMTGEAYFEIKADKEKPFIVKTISDEIQVLGTSFNINAYDDAPVKTSLLEGSVRIKSFILKPGQAFANGKIITTNLEQDIAWKNGYFNFEGADLQSIMKQFERWYDIQVVYGKPIEKRIFHGRLRRDLTLNEVCVILNDIGLKYTLKEKILYIE